MTVGTINTSGNSEPVVITTTAGAALTIGSYSSLTGTVTLNSAGGVLVADGVPLGAGTLNVTAAGTFTNGAGSQLSTTDGDLTITADAMTLGADITSTAAVTLLQNANGTAINLGGADASGTLGLTNSELQYVSAVTLKIGSSNSGNITVTDNITLPTSTNVELTTGGDLIISGGQVNTGGGTLLLHPGTGAAVKPTKSGTDATASTVSFGSNLNINIDGTTVDTQYTQLNVSGTVDLAGVSLVLTGSHVPAVGDVFTIVSATSVTNTFTGLADGAIFAFNGQNLRINYTSTTVTLTDCETAVFTINDVTKNESDGTMTFTVSLSNPINTAAKVNVSFTDVTTSTADFAHATQQVTFAANTTTAQTVTLAITDDNIVESDGDVHGVAGAGRVDAADGLREDPDGHGHGDDHGQRHGGVHDRRRDGERGGGHAGLHGVGVEPGGHSGGHHGELRGRDHVGGRLRPHGGHGALRGPEHDGADGDGADHERQHRGRDGDVHGQSEHLDGPRRPEREHQRHGHGDDP